MASTQVTDADLLAYLSGEADVELSQRIERDPQMKPRIQVLQQWETSLNQALDSLERPDSLTLAEYQLGLLPPAEAEAVETYLRQHPHATHQQSLLAEFLADIDPEFDAASPTIPQQIKVLVAALLSPGTARMQPVMGGIRGSQEGIYQVDDIQIIIQVEDDMDNPLHKTVIGLVQGIEPQQLRVQLLRPSDTQTLVTTPLDEFGNFMLSDLTSGRYHLVISNTEATLEIHVPEFQV